MFSRSAIVLKQFGFLFSPICLLFFENSKQDTDPPPRSSVKVRYIPGLVAFALAYPYALKCQNETEAEVRLWSQSQVLGKMRESVLWRRMSFRFVEASCSCRRAEFHFAEGNFWLNQGKFFIASCRSWIHCGHMLNKSLNFCFSLRGITGRVASFVNLSPLSFLKRELAFVKPSDNLEIVCNWHFFYVA